MIHCIQKSRRNNSQSNTLYLMTRQKEIKRKSSHRKSHHITSSSPPSIISTPPTTITTTTTTTTNQPIRQSQKHLSNRALAAQEFLNRAGQRILVHPWLRPTILVKAFGQVYSLLRRCRGRGAIIPRSRTLATVRFMMARGMTAVVRRIGFAIIVTMIVSRTMRSVNRGMLGVIVVEGELHAFTSRRGLAC